MTYLLIDQKTLLVGLSFVERRRRYKRAHTAFYSREYYLAHREQARAYRVAHREERRLYEAANKERDRASFRRCAARVKLEAFNAYGGPRCACCGETLLQGLGIDHINGDGSRHRRERSGGGTALYYWLRRHNYPPGFQVLCATCNVAKGTSDHCPHRNQKEPPLTIAQEEPAGT